MLDSAGLDSTLFVGFGPVQPVQPVQHNLCNTTCATRPVQHKGPPKGVPPLHKRGFPKMSRKWGNCLRCPVEFHAKTRMRQFLGWLTFKESEPFPKRKKKTAPLKGTPFSCWCDTVDGCDIHFGTTVQKTWNDGLHKEFVAFFEVVVFRVSAS